MGYAVTYIGLISVMGFLKNTRFQSELVSEAPNTS